MEELRPSQRTPSNASQTPLRAGDAESIKSDTTAASPYQADAPSYQTKDPPAYQQQQQQTETTPLFEPTANSDTLPLPNTVSQPAVQGNITVVNIYLLVIDTIRGRYTYETYRAVQHHARPRVVARPPRVVVHSNDNPSFLSLIGSVLSSLFSTSNLQTAFRWFGIFLAIALPLLVVFGIGFGIYSLLLFLFHLVLHAVLAVVGFVGAGIVGIEHFFQAIGRAVGMGIQHGKEFFEGIGGGVASFLEMLKGLLGLGLKV